MSLPNSASSRLLPRNEILRPHQPAAGRSDAPRDAKHREEGAQLVRPQVAKDLSENVHDYGGTHDENEAQRH